MAWMDLQSDVATRWRRPGTNRRRRGVALITLLVTTCALTGCETGISRRDLFPMPVLGWLLPSPDAYGLGYENVKIEVDGNKTLRGWFIPADSPRGTVLIHHGAFFSRSFDAPQIILFNGLGLNVMIADYQGYGDSDGTARLDTVLPDANAVLQYLESRTDPGTDRILLYGVSMGTMPALAQAAEGPPRVVGVIVEGVVQMDTLVPFGFDLLGLPPAPDSLTRVAADLDPARTVPDVTIPKLFLQSREDVMTPFDGAVELFDAAPEPKELVPIVGMHGFGIIADPNYRDEVATFVDSLLGG